MEKKATLLNIYWNIFKNFSQYNLHGWHKMLFLQYSVLIKNLEGSKNSLFTDKTRL